MMRSYAGLKTENLCGKKFGRLLVTDFAYRNKYRKTYWNCICDCGKKITARSDLLKCGNTKSCGCYSRDIASKTHLKHGLSGSKLYDLYHNMLNRCYKDRSSRNFKNYGGRGICVCDEWKKDRMSFFEWALSNGYKDGLEIDRIDNNGDYSPNNCVFTTKKVNNSHRRNTVHFYIGGKYFSSSNNAAKYFGVSEDTIRYWCGIHRIKGKRSKNKPGCFAFNPY